MSDECREISMILIATGLREESAAAVRLGRWLAGKLGAKVEAAHIIEPLQPSVLAAAPELEQAHEEAARKKLRAFLEEHGIEGAIPVHVETGEVVSELIQMQHRTRADLVLVGRPEGRGAMGSTGAGMARKMPVSVLIVPAGFVGAVQRLGVATDLTDESELGVRRALDLGRRLGLKEITLLHTYAAPVGYHTIATHEEVCARIEKNCRERGEAMVKRLAEQAGPGAPRVRIALAEGPPTEALVQLAEEEMLDLLVVSTHGRTGALSMFMGRTTEKILGRAPCAVWAERSPKLLQTALDALGELLH
ncbi:MAG: universal stress protein [Phycisphaerales bacterium JB039]